MGISNNNNKKSKAKKVKLLPHEEALLATGHLVERTHKGSTSRWLWAPSLQTNELPPPPLSLQEQRTNVVLHETDHNRKEQAYVSNVDQQERRGALPHQNTNTTTNKEDNNGMESYSEISSSISPPSPPSYNTLVYRPMGDTELTYLLQHGQLPDSRPYQAIIEGETGRVYAEKFLRGHKKVDTSPTTVVEFCVPRTLIDKLMAIQHKVEDGAISMGLGNKAGGGLPLFNAELLLAAATSSNGSRGFRIVLVKRKQINY